MVSGENIFSHEMCEAFSRILSVAKALNDGGNFTVEERDAMADNIQGPLFDIASMLGKFSAEEEFASIAAESGLTGWRK